MSSASFKILAYVVILCSALMANAAPKAGEVTWYDPKSIMSKTGVGACGGEPIDKSMPIAALAKAYFDSYPGAGANPNANPLCGKKIRVTVGGKSVTVTVRDRCDSCNGPFDVDLSQSSFAKLTDPNIGRLGGTWDFVNPRDDIGMKPGGAPRATVSRPHGRDSTNPGDTVRRMATDNTPHRMKKVKSSSVKVSRQTKRDEVVDKVKKREEPEKRPRRLSRVMRGIVLDDRQ